MKEALKTAMTTSISEVLETMFFMTIDLNEGAAIDTFLSDPGENPYISKIGFSGKVSGHFLLMIQDETLRNMTEGFMGLDAQAITEAHLVGTIQEAINMIAGNTFSNLDDQAVFELEIPEMTDLATVSANCMDQTPEELFILIETFTGKLGLKACFTID